MSVVTGVTASVAAASDSVASAASYISFILLGVLALFFIRSGYPALIAL